MEGAYFLLWLRQLPRPQVEGVGAQAHMRPWMSMRNVFTMLVALAVLFAPAFTRAGAAIAAAADHHSQRMEAGHCKMAPDEGSDDPSAAAESCCVSMCMALGLAPGIAASHDAVHAAAPTAVARAFRLSLPPEIATPPPRTA